MHWKASNYKKCEICGEEDVQPSHFWREHGIKESEYCLTYMPRYSKLTGKLLSFKNRDFYFNSHFENKNELRKWLSENIEEGVEYAKDFLRARLEAKKIQYAPSQVEMKSLVAPNVLWYEKFVKNYNVACDEIGLKTRFLYKEKPNFITDINLPITIDTREQKPLKFNISCSSKLDFGDYWAESSLWSHIYVERKSLPDFVSTLSTGYERFEREILRAQSKNKYLFILVEECLTNALAFNYLPHMTKKIKASPDFIFKRVRDLMQKFPNIQFLFADGRPDSVALIHKIYGCEKDPTQYDFQFLRDSKMI
jgi:hypothetical protein